MSQAATVCVQKLYNSTEGLSNRKYQKVLKKFCTQYSRVLLQPGVLKELAALGRLSQEEYYEILSCYGKLSVFAKKCLEANLCQGEMYTIVTFDKNGLPWIYHLTYFGMELLSEGNVLMLGYGEEVHVSDDNGALVYKGVYTFHIPYQNYVLYDQDFLRDMLIRHPAAVIAKI